MQHMHPALEIQGAISISVLVCVFTGRFNSDIMSERRFKDVPVWFEHNAR